MIPDKQLSPHFGLYELTQTSNPALQEQNRAISCEQIDKLSRLAVWLELLRDVVGPMRVHSGYRCDAVNGATSGSSSTSQHPRCEAIDFDCPGQAVEMTHRTLWQSAKEGRFRFGQLIVEACDRGYKNPDGSESISRWVHISIPGTLEPEKCGTVESANWDAEQGKFIYTLLDKIG